MYLTAQGNLVIYGRGGGRCHPFFCHLPFHYYGAPIRPVLVVPE